jgi:hypothetical protein
MTEKLIVCGLIIGAGALSALIIRGIIQKASTTTA